MSRHRRQRNKRFQRGLEKLIEKNRGDLDLINLKFELFGTFPRWATLLQIFLWRRMYKPIERILPSLYLNGKWV